MTDSNTTAPAESCELCCRTGVPMRKTAYGHFVCEDDARCDAASQCNEVQDYFTMLSSKYTSQNIQLQFKASSGREMFLLYVTDDSGIEHCFEQRPGEEMSAMLLRALGIVACA
jgi:hypothetical protein